MQINKLLTHVSYNYVMNDKWKDYYNNKPTY